MDMTWRPIWAIMRCAEDADQIARDGSCISCLLLNQNGEQMDLLVKDKRIRALKELAGCEH